MTSCPGTPETGAPQRGCSEHELDYDDRGDELDDPGDDDEDFAIEEPDLPK